MIDNIKQRFIELAGPEPKDHLNRVKWNHRLEGFRLAFKDQEPFQPTGCHFPPRQH